MNKDQTLGVIVGRFQLDTPHIGHVYLIAETMQRCDKLVIFLGWRRVRSASDPLSFEMRKEAIMAIPGIGNMNIEIRQLNDSNDNAVWLENLNMQTQEIAGPAKIEFFGSRDSFLSYLPFEWKKTQLDPPATMSASGCRAQIVDQDSREFRAGYIKAVQDEYPACGNTVDMLVTKGNQVLIGYKEKLGHHVTVGGHVDQNNGTLEANAVRETLEECGLDVHPEDLKYVCSLECTSWAYSRHRQPYTVVFTAEYTTDMGIPTAGDDLDEVGWVDMDKAVELLKEPHHAEMVQKLMLKNLISKTK